MWTPIPLKNEKNLPLNKKKIKELISYKQYFKDNENIYTTINKAYIDYEFSDKFSQFLQILDNSGLTKIKNINFTPREVDKYFNNHDELRNLDINKIADVISMIPIINRFDGGDYYRYLIDIGFFVKVLERLEELYDDIVDNEII